MGRSEFQAADAALSRLTVPDMGHIEARRQILDVLRRTIGLDEGTISTVDPATLLLTTSVGSGEKPAGPVRQFLLTLLPNEYCEDDVHKIRSLASGQQPVGVLSFLGEAARQSSSRYAALKEAGFADELRCALLQGRECWGSLMLYRAGGVFTHEDADDISRLAPLVTRIVRFALLRQAVVKPDNLLEPPGVVLVDGQGHIEIVSEPARQWLNDLDYGYTGPEAVQSISLDLRNSGNGMAFAFAPGRSGRWVRLHATWADPGGHQETVVVLEPARPVELADILGRACGMTSRERQVTMWIARGLSSKEIGRELGISAMTVNDHLKAVFAKVGVHSRRQLVANLYFDHC